MPETEAIIGANLRRLRLQAGLSQQKLGQILGVSYQQVQKYERGLNRFPAEKLYQAKYFFRVPYELFFTGFPAFNGPSRPPCSYLYRKLQQLPEGTQRQKIEEILFILLESQ